jgi:hypothetical protein
MSEEFAGIVLEHEGLFTELIQCVENAGKATVFSKRVLATANLVCVAGQGMENLNRRMLPLEVFIQQERKGKLMDPMIPTVNFDARSITLVGGGAIKAYDICFRDRGISYTNPKKTPDLDFVWWPTIVLPGGFPEFVRTHAKPLDTTKYTYLRDVPMYYQSPRENPFFHAEQFCVVSSSMAIQTVIGEFEKNLFNQLDLFVQRNIEGLLHIARVVYKTPAVAIGVRTAHKNVFVAGICNVFGYLVVTVGDQEYPVQIIEFTIHDGASSQISTTLEPAISDPVFSMYTTRATMPFSCITLQKNSSKFTVPLLDRLLDQQFFALRRRYMEYRSSSVRVDKNVLLSKIESHFRRCHYIYFGLLMLYKFGQIMDPIFLEAEKVFETYKGLFENTEEWIASCMDPVLEKCGILRSNPIFRRLCKEGKMIQMQLCAPVAPPQPPVHVTQPRSLLPTPLQARGHVQRTHPRSLLPTPVLISTPVPTSAPIYVYRTPYPQQPYYGYRGGTRKIKHSQNLYR